MVQPDEGLWIHSADRLLRAAKLAAVTGCTVVVISFIWQAARWQNSIRELMQLEPVDTAHPLEVALIALAAFAILVALARLFQRTLRFVAISVNRFLPRRVANVIGLIAAAALFWTVINGALFRVALGVADASYRELDKLIEPEAERPTDPLKTGSSASCWPGMNSDGRDGSSSPRGRPARRSALFRGGTRSSRFASTSA